MKRIVFPALCLLLLCLLFPAAAEDAEVPSISGNAAEITKFGHIMLDITVDDFAGAGFDLGDIVTVKAGSFEEDMPYFNGYYVDPGEYLVCAYPGYTNISVCINYGNFAEATGIRPGDPVTLTLKEKAGELALQEISSLVYYNERERYPSDEVFANFRPVIAGKLYRSASPVDNSFSRAATADRLIREAGIQTVMNLANTEEELAACLAAEDFASPYYGELCAAGSVIPLGMPANFTSEEFANGIVRGFTFLADHETPFLLHCTEGKDRAGFAAMLLEMLAGFDTDEIIADYMLSYENYYQIEAGSEKYNLIMEKNILQMMRMIAGPESETSLEGTDWKAAAEQYLTAHGMNAGTITVLESRLSDSSVPDGSADAPRGHYTFQPVVSSVYLEEVFGRSMCEAWANLVNAVMAGEDTFECRDQVTYNWVMGQFPNKCFPVLKELIDYAWNRSHCVTDGVASFTYLVPPEEAAARIAEFAAQVEGILNRVLEDDYSDLEKALALYDYFSRTYAYDYDTAREMEEKYVDYTSSLRFFKTGIGICHEISNAYSYLLMQAGVDATTMMGGNHEWSYVRINSRDYHIDPTFVISDKGSLAYFMMTDEQREATGSGRDTWFITSNYSKDHPHPDYAADDDTFRPLWNQTFESFSHENRTILCIGAENDHGEYEQFEFDYTGY